jgi:hypothetical protein
LNAPKKKPRSYLIGYKLREIEAESKFSQALSLAAIDHIVPRAAIMDELSEAWS